MKKLISFLAVLSLAAAAHGQGYIYLSNLFNTNNDPHATSSGLVWLQTDYTVPPVPINQDFNMVFYGGSDSSNLSLLRSFIGVTATGISAGGPGTFFGLFGGPAQLPGATNSAFFRIETWLGNAPVYYLAQLWAVTPVFQNPLGTEAAPAYMTEVPAILMALIPEPSSFTLVAFGALALWAVHRRRRSDQ